MSINNNVHNLKNCHCHRNVLCDPEKAKADEIKRRRLLRIEQVRQQSKAHAAKIRRDVHDEHLRQLARIEQIKNDELRAWKDKYIGETQLNYKKCLSRVGEAHAAAARENDLARKAEEQRIKNHRLATKRGKEALASIRNTATNAKRQNVAATKKTATVTIATQVNDSLDRVAPSYEAPTPPPQQSHVYAEANIFEPNPVNVSSSSNSDSFLHLEQQIQQHDRDPSIHLTTTDPAIVNISSDSLSSSIEILAKGSKLSKTLPLACSKTTRPTTDNAVDSGASSAHYSASKYVAADTSSESTLTNDRIDSIKGPKDVAFTQVSDLINKRKMNKVTIQNDSDGPKAPITQSRNDAPSRNAEPTTRSSITANIPTPVVATQSKSTTNAKHSTVARNFLKKKNSPSPRKHGQPLKSANLRTKAQPSTIHKEYIPLFVKPTTSSKLFVEGRGISRPQSNVWPKPTASTVNVTNATEALLAEQSPPKVSFYDHANRYGKEYEAPENCVQKVARNDAMPTAMTAALEEIQLEAERNERAEQLRRLTEKRCQQSLEKECIRKDYDLMTAQLDELCKKEDYAKMYALPNASLSEKRLHQLAAERQHNMNQMVEDALHKPVLITCPRLPNSANNTNRSASDLNVAFDTGTAAPQPVLNSSGESCSSILLGYVDSRSRTLLQDIGQHHSDHNGSKLNELLGLLDQLNAQKVLLLEEIERHQDAVPSSNLKKFYKTVRKIDKEKMHLMGAGEKENRPADHKTSEPQVALNKQRLEAKIRELIADEQAKSNAAKHLHKNVQIQTEADESSDVNSGAPLKIIINVTGKGKLEHIVTDGDTRPPSSHSQTRTAPVSDDPGQVFPKTPMKRTENSTKVGDSKVTTARNPALHIDADGSSTSTAYRSYPDVIHTNVEKGKKLIRPTIVTTPALGHYITRLLGMSRASIEQLGVSSCTTVETPTNSLINVSTNMSSSDDGVIDEERLQKLKRFIDDNHSFLSDIEQSLRQSNVSVDNADDDANMKTIETVWMKTLERQETEMKRMKKESRRLKEQLRKKDQPAPRAPTPQPIRPILKKPTSPKRVQVIVNEDTAVPLGTSTSPTHDVCLLQRYENITMSCSKRIANLEEMINQVRREKKKLQESTLTSDSTVTTSSDRAPNSTEYLELSNRCAPDDTLSAASDLRTHEECVVSEECGRKLANSRQIGISRDSGICISRPMTATDVRDRISPVDTSEGNDAADLAKDSDAADAGMTLSSPKKDSKVLQKPPPALKRYSPTLEHERLHELSTIVEVDTPGTSRLNASTIEPPPINQHVSIQPSSLFELSAGTRKALQIAAFPSPAKIDDDVLVATNNSVGETSRLDSRILQIQTFPSHQEFGNETTGLCDSASLDAVDQQKDSSDSNVATSSAAAAQSGDLAFRQFPTHQEFAAGVSGLCDSVSIAAALQQTETECQDLSIPDVEAELKKRHLITRSFESLCFQSSDDERPVAAQTLKHQRRPLTMHSSSSSDQLENDMKAIGLPWASAMLKKNKERQTLSSSTSSSGAPIKLSSTRSLSTKRADSFVDSKLMNVVQPVDESPSMTTASSVNPGKPLNLKAFLANELQKKSQSMSSSISMSDDSSSLASQFLRSMQQVSEKQTTHRTSTPVQNHSMTFSKNVVRDGESKTSKSNCLFSGESAISSVRESSATSTSGKESSDASVLAAQRQREYDKVLERLDVPDLKLSMPSSSGSSNS